MEKKSNGESDVNAKWDACLDLSERPVVYSSLDGALAGLLFFRSRVTRWASIAFGAGIGIGSAYAESSPVFNDFSSSTSATLLPPPKSTVTSYSLSQAAEEA